MATFYRVVSRIPLEKPTLVIGSVIPAGSGFVTTYSKPTRSRKKADGQCKALKKLHRFGTHTVQTIEAEGGLDVQTDRGVVTTEEEGKGRRG